MAATLGIGDRLVLAGGLTAPDAGLHRHDDDGPQRYASASLAGSALLYIYRFRAAYRVTERFRIGATVTPRLTTSRPSWIDPTTIECGAEISILRRGACGRF